MSYGVAFRNGVPFTLGTIAALCVNATTQWNPLSLWPGGIATPGMWISPRDLTSQWQDYTGTTPVVEPGTVADSSNPVGLALDIRAGATVLTDPGNHMLQSTSAARPLLSARVNLLTYTEDFSNAAWYFASGDAFTVTPDSATAPDGSLVDVINTAAGGTWLAQNVVIPAGGACHVYVKLVGGTGGNARVRTVGELGNEIVLDSTWKLTQVNDPAAAAAVFLMLPANSNVAVYQFQTEVSPTPTTYQAVPGNGSSYYATGFPIAQKYDGVDDGMATAAFSAGTLISGMDCMIAVRRDSEAQSIVGIYNSFADGSRFTGVCESGSSGSCVGTFAGTPTVWVDGVQLAGGTAVTRDTLNTALSTGTWHILELQGLDLSTWTQVSFGLWGGSYPVNGPRGDILLYPSTASTEDKDAARQWLADYYGVTLP